MASIPPLSQNFYSTNLANTSAGQIQMLNQGRMQLANVAGNFQNPNQIASLQLTDKAFELQGIRDQTNFQVSQAMLEGSGSTLKKNDQQRQRLMGNGAIFA